MLRTTASPSSSRKCWRAALAPVAALTLSLSLMAGQAAAAQAMDKEELQQIYTTYLDEQGFRPTISDLGNVLFKAESRTYVIYLDAKDAQYFRLVLSFTADDDADKRLKRLEALNEVSRTIKTVKGHIGSNGSINFSVEMFQAVPGDARKNLPRMLRALRQAVDKYAAKIKASN